MTGGFTHFAALRIAWADAAASTDPPVEVLHRLGPTQVHRYRALQADAARRFLVGRALLVSVIEEMTSAEDLTLSTVCERCGGDHGRPRLERAPVAVSISYAGTMVAVAAGLHVDAVAVGVDLEVLPAGGASQPLHTLDRLFLPHSPPDTAGWSLIEAAVKADGRGLTIDLADVIVGDVGTGTSPRWRAVRVPGRLDPVDAAVVSGPPGFVLSAAMVPAAGERHPA